MRLESTLHRLVRVALSLVAAAVVCLVSRSALAAAPLCDARAASAVAPNPTLQSSSSASVDVTPDDCSGRTFGVALERGHAPSAPDAASDAAPRAAVPAALRILPASATAGLAHFDETFTLPAGVRDRVERPPRA